MIVFIEKTLEELRERIKGIDYSIMSLISQRISLAKEIGLRKQELNLPIKNYQVEKAVYDRINTYAEDFEMEKETAKLIFANIISSSVNAQVNQLDNIETNELELKSVLIIGGLGKMGAWFNHYFKTLGHSVDIVDPVVVDESEHNFRSLPNDLDKYAIIAICTPLSIIHQTIEEICKRIPIGPLIFDIASLKSGILDKISTAEELGMKYISVHPLFGPDIKELAGRNMIICTTSRSKKNELEFKRIFKDTSVNLTSIELDKHDDLMLYSLSLSHLINLLFGKILIKSNFPFSYLLKFAGTTFLKQIDTTIELFNENPELYFAIQTVNVNQKLLAEMLSSELNFLQQTLRNNSKEEFVNMMIEGKAYFSK